MKLTTKIIKESIKVLIIASILSSIGGIALEKISGKLIIFLPLLIIIPALNNMIGGFGVILVSKFTTSLFEHKIKSPWYKSHFVKHLFTEVFPIAIICSIYISVLATTASLLIGIEFMLINFIKIIVIALISTIILILIIFLISIIGGIYIYHKKQDPDDVLIPITTSIADLGSMIIFTLLVLKLF